MDEYELVGRLAAGVNSFLFRKKPSAERFERWANHYTPVGTGLKMLSAQAANEALRHCRIGMVRKKVE